MSKPNKARMYITKTSGAMFPQPFCVERDGVTLSLGGDDNCGLAKNFERLDIIFYDSEGNDIKDHPLIKKYGDDDNGFIPVWHDPELLAKVISEFVA